MFWITIYESLKLVQGLEMTQRYILPFILQRLINKDTDIALFFCLVDKQCNDEVMLCELSIFFLVVLRLESPMWSFMCEVSADLMGLPGSPL